MGTKLGILLLALIAGCFAVPTSDVDISQFFEHVDVGARIVGGTEAAQSDHTHIAAMTNGVMIRSFVCGSSIVTPRTLLTAAHCIEAVFSWGSISSSLRVTVGTNRWNLGGQSYNIARNISHPNYVSSTIKNDIGLLITTSDIQLSSTVSLVSLSFDFVGGGVATRAAGWGRIRAGGALSPVLLELTKNTLTGEECIQNVATAAAELNMRPLPVEPHIEICTFHSRGHGMCNGDSGSPLLRTDNRQQVALVAWGFPCALGAPDMFTRISAFEGWLRSNVI